MSTSQLAEVVTPDRHRQLGRRAQLLAGASVAYNLVEAAVAITAGVIAGSVALIGFGLDSVVEVSSGLVILWQFRHPMPESRERRALRLIAVSFFALAAYVTFESVRTLLGSGEARPSNLGIGIAVVSLAIMPALSWAQRRTGRELGSGSVVADSKQTLLCTYLSAVLLGGLVLNATVGWHWADPLAALVIAAVAVKEGIDAWKGDNCCPPMLSPEIMDAGTSAEAGCADDCCEVDAVNPARAPGEAMMVASSSCEPTATA
jgi:divalent metal cation (Fe/Co/Zn/Cd) transporter